MADGGGSGGWQGDGGQGSASSSGSSALAERVLLTETRLSFARWLRAQPLPQLMRVCDEVKAADAVRNAASRDASRESEAVTEARGQAEDGDAVDSAIAAVPDARVWSKVELTERSRLRVV